MHTVPLPGCAAFFTLTFGSYSIFGSAIPAWVCLFCFWYFEVGAS